jgi:hypothetical protein
MSDFISDEDMEKMEASPEAPDFISDDEMEVSAPVEQKPAGEILRDGTLGAGAGGLGGYVVGKGVVAGSKKLGNMIETTGSLKPDQMKFIENNVELYKNANPLEDMLNQFRDLAGKTRQAGFDYKNDALKALDGAEKIPVQEYYNAIGKVVEDPKYSSEVAPGVKNSILEKHLDGVADELAQESLNNKLMSVEEKIQTPFEDRRADFRNSQRGQSFERKMSQLDEANLPSRDDQIFGAIENERNLKQDRQQLRLGQAEEYADIQDAFKGTEASGRAHTVAKNKLDDFIYNRANQDARISTVKGAEDAQEVNKKQLQKEEAEFKKLQADERAAFDKHEKEKKRLEQLIEKKKALEEKQAKLMAQDKQKVVKAQAKADADFKKNVLRTPEEIRATNPEFFDGRTFDPDYAGALDKAVEKGRYVESLEPKRVAEGILPSLRDNANFSVTGASSVDEFNTDVSEGVRGWLGQKYPEYDKNMKNSSEAIAAEGKFGKTGAKFDDIEGKVIFPENKRIQLASIIISPEGEFVQEKAMLNDLFNQDLNKLGLNPSDRKFLEELKASSLKTAVKDTELLRPSISGYDAVNAAKGNPAGVAKPIFDKYKTRVQEQIALSKGGDGLGLLKKAGAIAEPVAKALPGILGAGGAFLAANQAAQADELSPTAALTAGTLDALNPTPTDVVAAAVEGKKGYNDSVNEQKMTEEYFNGGDVSEAQAVGNAALQGTKGFVSPIPTLAKAGYETMDEIGTSQSLSARERMEQNMQALNSLKNKDKPKTNDFLEFVEKNPESLQELAQTLEGTAASSYAGPLMKASQADERSRAAILFGLYQQPAFRSMVGGNGTLKSNNIPGVKKSDK